MQFERLPTTYSEEDKKKYPEVYELIEQGTYYQMECDEYGLGYYIETYIDGETEFLIPSHWKKAERMQYYYHSVPRWSRFSIQPPLTRYTPFHLASGHTFGFAAYSEAVVHEWFKEIAPWLNWKLSSEDIQTLPDYHRARRYSMDCLPAWSHASNAVSNGTGEYRQTSPDKMDLIVDVVRAL